MRRSRRSRGSAPPKSPRVWAAASRAATATIVIAAGSALAWILWRSQVGNTVGYDGKSAADWVSVSGASDPAARAGRLRPDFRSRSQHPRTGTRRSPRRYTS